MKILITTVTFFLMLQTVAGQWATFFSAQRTDDNPIISKEFPYFIFENDPTSGTTGGIVWGIFDDGYNDDDFNPEAQFNYNRSTNEWIFLKDNETTTDRPALTIDRFLDAPNSYGAGGLRLGNSETGSYLGFDYQDIQAWDSDETSGTLRLNEYGGNVKIGASGGYLFYNVARTAVGIGTTIPDALLDVDGSAIVRDSLAIGKSIPDFTLDVVGSGNFTGELTAASDARLKTNVKAIKGATDVLSGIKPVKYSFRSEAFPEMSLSTGDRYGVIAQELERVLPELVANKMEGMNTDGQKTTFKTVNYLDLLSMLIASHQEHAATIHSLKSGNAKLASLQGSLKESIKSIHTIFPNSKN